MKRLNLSFIIFVLTCISIFSYAFLGLPFWSPVETPSLRAWVLVFLHAFGLLFWPFKEHG